MKGIMNGHVEHCRRTDTNGHSVDDDSIALCETFECIYSRKGIDTPIL